MNTTTNTRGVSEAMVAELIAAGDFLAMNGTDGMVRRWEKAKAALSAPEPAAQGEEGFDARKYVRHMADVLEAGGDLFKVDADLLRLAAAINKAANTTPPAQLPEGIAEQVDELLRECRFIANKINKSEGEDYLSLSASLLTILNTALSPRRGFKWLPDASPAAGREGRDEGRAA